MSSLGMTRPTWRLSRRPSAQSNRTVSSGVPANLSPSVTVSRNSRSPLSSVSHISYSNRIRTNRLSSEDEKVSLDELQEKVAEFDDYVQSSDVAAMQSTYLPYLTHLSPSNSIFQNCKCVKPRAHKANCKIHSIRANLCCSGDVRNPGLWIHS